ncbi:MAG: helix-turn-helix transcriptional regulator [Deltaproteobacteria bacterium]|nr:helix-turn-helix transcriptional regulator [Deltaproteobacteria bacterium]
MNQSAVSKDIQNPQFRYSLKARIIETGHKSLTDFSKATGINLPIISSIVSGWQFPGPNYQKRMARCLGITLRELKELL